jgi:hypothetical protein
MGFIEIKKIKIYDTIKSSYRVGKKLLDTSRKASPNFKTYERRSRDVRLRSESCISCFAELNEYNILYKGFDPILKF